MNKQGFAAVLLIPLVLFVFAIGFFGFQAVKYNFQDNYQFDLTKPAGKKNIFSQMYSRGKCEGEGTRTFTHLPMDLNNIGEVLPYGVMVDSHVIPTSHGYIGPADYQSKRDAYPVYAPADGVIVNVSHRGQFVGDNPNDRVTDEYQMYFEHSCTFYSYYDLLTSISPDIEKVVGKLTGFENKRVRIPVKGGQSVGRIGGQTVDFAVWNFEKEPAYFANPKSYLTDEDRFYLDDMFFYFEEPLKSQLLAKNKRTAEPRSGKVAYDIEGKLVGNWFSEGSGGFRGPPGEQGRAGGRYWDGHLSISYDYIVPTQIIFSIGNFEDKSAQFSIKGNSPDPATIGIESGPVRYELTSSVLPDSPPGYLQGTVLLQLIEPSKLKLELFPGKPKDQVNDFTSNAKIYHR